MRAHIADKPAALIGFLGGTAICAAHLRRQYGAEYVRAIAYHAVPKSSLDSFKQQLDWLAERYECFCEAELDAFCGDVPHDELDRRSGQKTGASGVEAGAHPEGTVLNGREKPGLVISFDDGQINNYRYAVPALEERALRGWFFIPSEAPRQRGEAERVFCDAGTYKLPTVPESDGRLVMNWDELKDLAQRGHVIGCHTADHRRLRNSLTGSELQTEISGAKEEIEANLGRKCLSFAFVGGEPDTYSDAAYRKVEEAGFRYAFTTLSAPFYPAGNKLLIHRTVLDADMDFNLFKFKISGLSDLVHRKTRKEIESRLGSL